MYRTTIALAILLFSGGVQALETWPIPCSVQRSILGTCVILFWWEKPEQVSRLAPEGLGGDNAGSNAGAGAGNSPGPSAGPSPAGPGPSGNAGAAPDGIGDSGGSAGSGSDSGGAEGCGVE